MRLKLDENLGRRGVQTLRRAGHDLATKYEQSLTGTNNLDLIHVCRHETRALVTLDLGSRTPFATTRRPTPADLDAAIQTLVEALVERSVEGKLWIVERVRIREYQPDR